MCLLAAAPAAAAAGTTTAGATAAAATTSWATYAAYAAMAVSAVSTALQFQQQKDVSAAQTKAIQDGYARDQAAALRQYQENNTVAQQDMGEQYKNAMIEESRLKAIGAESGLQGVSNDRIQQDAANSADKDLATIEANLVRQNEAAHTSMVSKQSQATSQMLSTKRPSALGAGLQIGASALSTYYATQKPNNLSANQANKTGVS